jgi:hypothetical protein
MADFELKEGQIFLFHSNATGDKVPALNGKIKIDGKEHASSTTRVTPKGIDAIRKNLIKFGYLVEEDLFMDTTEMESI